MTKRTLAQQDQTKRKNTWSVPLRPYRQGQRFLDDSETRTPHNAPHKYYATHNAKNPVAATPNQAQLAINKETKNQTKMGGGGGKWTCHADQPTKPLGQNPNHQLLPQPSSAARTAALPMVCCPMHPSAGQPTQRTSVRRSSSTTGGPCGPGDAMPGPTPPGV
jgi:hypothetical protein